MALIAGSYSATYDPQGAGSGGTVASIGATREGFTIHEVNHHEPVNADYAGQVPIDGVNQGTEVEVRLDFIEYDKILPLIYAQNPRGAGIDNVGQLHTNLAGILVLTPVAGTPAKLDDSSLVWTFWKAIVVSDVETLLASRLRQGPITLHCYPDPAHSNHAFDRA